MSSNNSAKGLLLTTGSDVPSLKHQVKHLKLDLSKNNASASASKKASKLLEVNEFDEPNQADQEESKLQGSAASKQRKSRINAVSRD